MITICTLENIFPAMRNATDEEAMVMNDGMKMISESDLTVPLMNLRYALNDQAREVVNRYVDIE